MKGVEKLPNCTTENADEGGRGRVYNIPKMMRTYFMKALEGENAAAAAKPLSVVGRDERERVREREREGKSGSRSRIERAEGRYQLDRRPQDFGGLQFCMDHLRISQTAATEFGAGGLVSLY